MIYIKDSYIGFDIALTNIDGRMELENLQSFKKYNVELTPCRVEGRCTTYNLTYVDEAHLAEFQQGHTQEQYDELTGSNCLYADDTNWLYLPEGSYKYVMDGEVGLLKTGMQVERNSYETQTENKIYYKG